MFQAWYLQQTLPHHCKSWGAVFKIRSLNSCSVPRVHFCLMNFYQKRAFSYAKSSEGVTGFVVQKETQTEDSIYIFRETQWD